MMQQRKAWIDWAKILGMLAIIYGHFFPIILGRRSIK